MLEAAILTTVNSIVMFSKEAVGRSDSLNDPWKKALVATVLSNAQKQFRHPSKTGEVILMKSDNPQLTLQSQT